MTPTLTLPYDTHPNPTLTLTPLLRKGTHDDVQDTKPDDQHAHEDHPGGCLLVVIIVIEPVTAMILAANALEVHVSELLVTDVIDTIIHVSHVFSVFVKKGVHDAAGVHFWFVTTLRSSIG